MVADPNSVATIVEHVEHESYDLISLNQLHTTYVGLEGLGTAMANIILFENEATVSYHLNPIDNEDEDDNVESDVSDSRESGAEEDVLPHETPFVPKFRLVDASNDDKAASYGALPQHLFFDGNKELRKGMVFGSKE